MGGCNEKPAADDNEIKMEKQLDADADRVAVVFATSKPPKAGSVAARAARFEKANENAWMSRKPSDLKKRESSTASRIRGARKAPEQKVQRKSAVRKDTNRVVWSDASPEDFHYPEQGFGGSYSFTKQPELEKCQGSVQSGIQRCVCSDSDTVPLLESNAPFQPIAASKPNRGNTRPFSSRGTRGVPAANGRRTSRASRS